MGLFEERNNLAEAIKIVDSSSFSEVALSLFRFQAKYNLLYNSFLKLVHCNPKQVNSLDQIPFLPIETFKHHIVKTGAWETETIFKSSGQVKSEHHIRSVRRYHQQAVASFEHRFGSLSEFSILALLPHYLQAGQSSLVSMVRAFMMTSNQADHGFFIDDFEALIQAIQSVGASSKRLLLIGVTYALLDFAEAHPTQLPSNTLLIETGGMKGRKEEWHKKDLHLFLKEKLQIPDVYSEYGMTELMSQAYTDGSGFFIPANTLKIFIKELNDPLTLVQKNKAGAVHLIDLANIDSCAFIATADVGRAHGKRGFEILGRLENSDLRGCQLMYL